MSKNQTPEKNENTLEDCSFSLVMKDGSAALKVEGTLGSLSEAFANVALHSEELAEMLKMSTFMLFQHEMNQMEGPDQMDIPAEANEILENLFGQMGQA